MAKAKKRQNRKAAQLTAVKERRPVLAPSEAPPVKEKRGRGRPRKRTRGPPRQGGQATEGVFLTERQAPVTDVVPQAAGQSHAPTHEQRRQQSPSPGPNILTQPPPKTVLEDLPALVDNTVVSLMFKLEVCPPRGRAAAGTRALPAEAPSMDVHVSAQPREGWPSLWVCRAFQFVGWRGFVEQNRKQGHTESRHFEVLPIFHSHFHSIPIPISILAPVRHRRLELESPGEASQPMGKQPTNRGVPAEAMPPGLEGSQKKLQC